jgi:inosine/xanthosine triphosphatase
MRVGVGGSFNILHKGHKALLDKAFEEGDEVAIAIMSDEFILGNKHLYLPLEERIEAIKEHVDGKGKPYTISVINDVYGGAQDDPNLHALVVSAETLANARRINELRVRKGLKLLEIIKVPHILADDYVPISSTRIIRGDINEDGHLLRSMRVFVGSANPVKINATRAVMEKIFEDVEVEDRHVDPAVPKEPWEGEVLKGAVNRARKALQEGDLGVGIEAGIYRFDDGLYDIQVCAIIDKRGVITHGQGMGFRYPPPIEDLLLKDMSVSEACEVLFKEKGEGRRGGAVGILSNGLMKRQQLTEQAVLAAMIPRIRKDIYF